MGHPFSAPQRLSRTHNQTFPHGLDRDRSVIDSTLGTYRAATSASFRSGAPVMLNSSGEVVLADVTQCIGVAMANKMTLGSTVVVDEEVTFGTAGAAVQLRGTNSVSEVMVRSAADFGGSAYTVTTDYTVTSGGLLTHVALGGIDEAEPVYVTYRYALVELDYQLEGKNFQNSLDDVTYQDNRIAVAHPGQDVIVFTTEFETDVAYALTGATSNIYVNSSGLFTSSSGGSARLVGTVFQVPEAGDEWLGIRFRGSALVNT